MTPADLREWWLALGAISASLTAGSVQAQTPTEKAGIVSGVVPGAKGSNQSSADQVIVIGNDVYRQERITTDAKGTVHLLFLDQSSITLGPNSDIVIDRFVYDPETGKGNLAVTTTKGLLRVVGGKLSKQADTVVNTPLATIGIRGGISTVETEENGSSNNNFLFGDHMNVQGQDGQTRNVTRPGFGVSVRNGQTGQIQRTPPNLLSNQLNRLNSPTPQNQPTSNNSGNPLVSNRNSAPGNNPSSISPNRIQQQSDNTLNTNPNNVRNTLNLRQENLGSTQPATTSS